MNRSQAAGRGKGTVAGAFVLLANGCLSGATTTARSDSGAVASRPPCAIDSDAGVGSSGPPYCYPESTKPEGACLAHTPMCAFCSYPKCAVSSGLIEPHTFYECSCTGGTWNCRVVGQFGTQCPAVLTCLGPDGGLGVSCLSGGGESCEMPEGGSEPVCVFAHGLVPSCGKDSCSIGCTCVDPSGPTCACQ
jgi:hypothetical protein